MLKSYPQKPLITVSTVGVLAIVLVFAIACMTLVGYALNLRILEAYSPYWTPMRVITALCLIMSAAALLLLRKEPTPRRASRWAAAMGATVCAAGLLTFAGYLFELGTGPTPPFYHTIILSQFLAAGPRMAVITSVLFTLYGCIIILLSSGGRLAAGIGHGVLMLVSLAVYLVLAGYVLDIPALYTRMNLGIALNTDIAFFCLCIAGFCARPSTWLMGVFTSEGAGGAMSRRLLPSLLALPLIIGWLRIGGERLGIFSSPVGVALVAATYTVCFLWLVWLAARSVNRTDLLRRKAEEGIAFQAHLLSNVHDAVIGLDTGYVVNYWNDAAQKMYGWTAEEAIGKRSFDILQTVYIGCEREEVAEKIRAEGRTAYEATHRTKDGKVLNVDVHSALARDSDGKIMGYISSCRDVTERKRAQETLRKNEATLQGILDASQESIWQFSTDGRILMGNPTALKRFGRPAEEVIGRHFNEILPHNLARSRMARLEEAVESKKPVEFEDERAGIVFRHSFYPVVDGGGNVSSIACFSRDITERNKAEKERERLLADVKVEKDRLLSLINSIQDEVWFADTQKHFTLANPQALREFGISGSSTDLDIEKFAASLEVFRPDGSPRPVEDAPPLRALAGEIIRGQEEMVKIPSKGELRYRSVSASPVRDASGAIIGSISVVHDITARKRAEEALKRTNDELEARVDARTAEVKAAFLYNRSLLEASLDPLVTISPEGKITDVNIATELATGLARELLVGTNFSDYFTDPSRANEGYRKVLADGFVRDYPLTLRHSSGSVIDVLYNATVYKDADGKVTGVFAAARDITAKKAVEAELERHRLHLEELVKLRTAELERSNKDLEQFAYVASHDLQEPLRAIGGFVDLLKQQLAGALDAKKQEYMDFIVDGVLRMRALINGLLEFSRVETRGKAPEKVDANAALERALLNLQSAINESGASILADSLPEVHFDKTQLSQLFQNLVGNAIKYRASAPPEIRLTASRDNGYWKFSVADNGIGIDPQYSERIFMIFQRLHTRKHYAGTGIGLAICKRIVERHGGRIWVESVPGKGSTFYFTIPDKGE